MPLPNYRAAERSVLLHELKHDLGVVAAHVSRRMRRYGRSQTSSRSIAHTRPTSCPGSDRNCSSRPKHSAASTPAVYLDALATCAKGSREDGLDRAFDRHRLDAVIAPTSGLAWLIDPIAGDHSTGGFAGPAAVAGFPHLTVPAGFVRGLPIGLSFVGRPFTEYRLLDLGHAYEQATMHRRPPTYRPRSVPV